MLRTPLIKKRTQAVLSVIKIDLVCVSVSEFLYLYPTCMRWDSWNHNHQIHFLCLKFCFFSKATDFAFEIILFQYFVDFGWLQNLIFHFRSLNSSQLSLWSVNFYLWSFLKNEDFLGFFHPVFLNREKKKVPKNFNCVSCLVDSSQPSAASFLFIALPCVNANFVSTLHAQCTYLLTCLYLFLSW